MDTIDLLLAKELSTKSKLHELYYWDILRRKNKFYPWLATKLPRRLKYYVVIHGMVTVEPNYSPEYVKGMELLDLWEEKR